MLFILLDKSSYLIVKYYSYEYIRKDFFMLNKNSIQPLYKQLMDIITSQLKNGTYKPGEKIPTEPELAELYQVSRITVRRTIEELCTQGYLVKH